MVGGGAMLCRGVGWTVKGRRVGGEVMGGRTRVDGLGWAVQGRRLGRAVLGGRSRVDGLGGRFWVGGPGETALGGRSRADGTGGTALWHPALSAGSVARNCSPACSRAPFLQNAPKRVLRDWEIHPPARRAVATTAPRPVGI